MNRKLLHIRLKLLTFFLRLRSLASRSLGFTAEVAGLSRLIVLIRHSVHHGFLFFLFSHKVLLIRLLVVLCAIGVLSLPDSIGACKGWDCDTVKCWDGYAVRLPDGRYLPCELFDDYINGDKSVAIGEPE